MSSVFGPNPVVLSIEGALADLEAGRPVKETRELDLKEEAGRRRPDGTMTEPVAESESAAQQLAAEAACMANTPGGGALLVGVSDDSTLVGTDLDAEWLRHRIYQITQRRLTAEIRPVVVHGVRLLVVRSPEAVEAIRVGNRLTWRADDHCVEIDAASWNERMRRRLGVDWSAQPSTRGPADISASALEVARRFLVASEEPHSRELAAASDSDLLGRIGAITPDGRLTKAAVLLFTPFDWPTIDYIHRDVHGGDSTDRVALVGVALVETLQEVFRAFSAHNPIRHVGSTAYARGQVRVIPERAAREAIVNAVAHRDWATRDPSTVEHIGRTLTVTSPGGFYGGVTSQNVITHPSRSRNAALTKLLRTLRVAEGEGIGVDRMYTDMLASGNSAPVLRELPDPAVQVSLSAELTDPAWPIWLDRIDDPRASQDLRWLIALDHLRRRLWLDARVLADLSQSDESQAEAAIAQIWASSVDGRPLLDRVSGVPTDAATAWTLTPAARRVLDDLDEIGAFHREPAEVSSIALNYASHRGRISSTELGSLLDAHPSNVSPVLRRLEEEGLLRPSRPNHRGRGFFYLPCESL